jgi:predicted enzyme related to lactoylglutathione lyase
MPYGDAKRAADFYKNAFGWQMNQLGEQMGNYITAWTGETDADGMVQKPGTINGGFYSKEMSPEGGTSVVIAVDDIHAAMKKVQEAGGSIVGEPAAIPGVGDFVSFTDTEGNRASMLQPKR